MIFIITAAMCLISLFTAEKAWKANRIKWGVVWTAVFTLCLYFWLGAALSSAISVKKIQEAHHERTDKAGF